MRLPRELAEDVWYEVRTAVNICEPLFQLAWAAVLFYRVLREAKGRFAFEMRGFAIEGVWLTFYIKPAEGFKLPKIMQWLKQTFSVRFNFRTGRTGHVWGDRYWSEILAGEPPPEAKEVDWDAVAAEAAKPVPAGMVYKLSWGSPRPAGMGSETPFRPNSRSPPCFRPANRPASQQRWCYRQSRFPAQRRPQGKVCPRHREKGEKEANSGPFPVCRGGETGINAMHSEEKRKKGVGEAVFAQILRLRAVPARLGQPPLGWNGLGNIFFAPIHVLFRVSVRRNGGKAPG
ncbi:MAG: hypothetical protein LBT00_05970 [Spirochaetaceae bacterium]|nr:hypothetical protein [Spirochaetaceae bacterium]